MCHVLRVLQELDVAAMRNGARHLLSKYDLTTFRSPICQAKSPVKARDALEIEEVEGLGGPELRFHLSARSFLYNQVRSIVGTLERVGAGSWTPEDVKTALETRDRAVCPPKASRL